MSKDATTQSLEMMLSAYQRLKALGWKNSMYAPKDGTAFLSISAGSTGIHETIRDKDGSFWVYDGETWPAHPILWKPKP